MTRTHGGPGLVGLGHQHRRQRSHPATDVADPVDPREPVLVRCCRPIGQPEVLEQGADLVKVTAQLVDATGVVVGENAAWASMYS